MTLRLMHQITGADADPGLRRGPATAGSTPMHPRLLAAAYQEGWLVLAGASRRDLVRSLRTTIARTVVIDISGRQPCELPGWLSLVQRCASPARIVAWSPAEQADLQEPAWQGGATLIGVGEAGIDLIRHCAAAPCPRADDRPAGGLPPRTCTLALTLPDGPARSAAPARQPADPFRGEANPCAPGVEPGLSCVRNRP